MKKQDGWFQASGSHGYWYNPTVSKGLTAHRKQTCDVCGEEYFQRIYRVTGKFGKNFCSKSCTRKYAVKFQDLSHLVQHRLKKGDRPHNFKGTHKHSAGYVCDYGEDRQKCLQHRLVVEKFIGRKLRRDEIIHHINGDVADNRIENLQIMKQSDHVKLHWTEGSFNNRETVKKERIIASWLKEQEMKKNIPKGDK